MVKKHKGKMGRKVMGKKTSGRHNIHLNWDLRLKTRLNIEVPYDTGIHVLGIYPRELKTCLHKKIVLWMFIAHYL